MQIASYRSVFDFERRIYRLDGLRLNPAGVPLRGIVYFAVFFIAAAAASRIPLLGCLAGLFPWWMRFLLAPALLAAVLVPVRIDGRVVHLVALSLARFGLVRRRPVALR